MMMLAGKIGWTWRREEEAVTLCSVTDCLPSWARWHSWCPLHSGHWFPWAAPAPRPDWASAAAWPPGPRWGWLSSPAPRPPPHSRPSSPAWTSAGPSPSCSSSAGISSQPAGLASPPTVCRNLLGDTFWSDFVKSSDSLTKGERCRTRLICLKAKRRLSAPQQVTTVSGKDSTAGVQCTGKYCTAGCLL